MIDDKDTNRKTELQVLGRRTVNALGVIHRVFKSILDVSVLKLSEGSYMFVILLSILSCVPEIVNKRIN